MELAAAVRHAFAYSADGKLLWQNPPKNHAGLRLTTAGGLNPKGYWIISFQSCKYRRSQLIFLYHHGRLPRPVCDHINRNRADDRIENLRELSVADNNRNNTKRSITQRSSGKYQVRLGRQHIGMFNTLTEAEQAYDRSKVRI